MVLAAAAILLLSVLLIPRGPVTLHTGRVTGFRGLSTETGTDAYATVNIEGHPTMVRLHTGSDCVVGSPIALRKARFLLGERYAVNGRGCEAPAIARPSAARP